MGISLTSTVIACMYAALWALMVCVKDMRLQALAIGAFFLVALFLVNIGGVLLA